MDITRMLTLSTAHITPDTRFILDHVDEHSDELDKIVVYPKDEYGWFIYIMEEMGAHALPADLQACIDLAKEHHCTMLCLDRDGDILEDLAVYDD